jgi:hypothetical protein
MICNRVKRTARWALAAFLFVSPAMCSSPATLDDLKKLEIICFVPSYLPEGFKLKAVAITYDELNHEDACATEFEIEKRNIQRDGKPVTIRMLRVSSYDQK